MSQNDPLPDPPVAAAEIAEPAVEPSTTGAAGAPREAVSADATEPADAAATASDIAAAPVAPAPMDPAPAETDAAVATATPSDEPAPPAQAPAAAVPELAPAAAVPELSPAVVATRLAQHFPALFGAGRALPIKLRIQADIQQRAPGEFTKKSLSIFLHRHTTSTAYLRALALSPHRFDLDGAAAGEVADDHRQAAAAEVERRRLIVLERRAAERQAGRPLPPPGREARPRPAHQGAVADGAAPIATGPAETLPDTTPPAQPKRPAPQNRPNPPQRPPHGDRIDRPQRGDPHHPRADAERPGARRPAQSDPSRGHVPFDPSQAGPRPQRPERPQRPPLQAHAPAPRRADERPESAAPAPVAPAGPQFSSAEFEARRERATLLRAFESTTLTTANFCALKGIKPAALEPLLTMARQERSERPAEPQRPQTQPSGGFGADNARIGRPRQDGGRRSPAHASGRPKGQ